MNAAIPEQRVILDAAIDGSVIRGTLTAHSGDFHGWLELASGLEAILDTRPDRAGNVSTVASGVVPVNAHATRGAAPVTQSVNASVGGRAPRPAPSAQ